MEKLAKLQHNFNRKDRGFGNWNQQNQNISNKTATVTLKIPNFPLKMISKFLILLFFTSAFSIPTNSNLTEVGYISENIARGWKIDWDCNKLGQCDLNCHHKKFGSKTYKNAIKVVNPNSKHGIIGDTIKPVESVSCTYDEDISGCRTAELQDVVENYEKHQKN